MGKWDRELIELLPKAVKVYASAGAGYDWVDTLTLAEFGELVKLRFARGRRFWFRWALAHWLLLYQAILEGTLFEACIKFSLSLSMACSESGKRADERARDLCI